MNLSSWTGTIAVMAGIVAMPAAAAAEARTFDRVTYTAPEGWKIDESKRELVSISKIGRDSYCLVAIYASTPASGDLNASFAAEWQAVALKTIAPVAAPTPTLSNVGSTRAAMGGAPSTVGGRPVVAVLMVLDAGASVVSVLILAPSMEAFEAYTADVQSMLGSLVVSRVDAAPPPPAAAPPADGKLVVPPPARPITVADLAGEWKNEDGVTTRYVYRDTGNYAGFDSIHTREKWTITAKGGYSSDFFAIRNGQKIVEQNGGSVTISGTVLSIKKKVGSQPSYVIRGWLDAPTMTVLKLNGPWYEDGVPADVLNNPQKGTNLDSLWIRSKSPPK